MKQEGGRSERYKENQTRESKIHAMQRQEKRISRKRKRPEEESVAPRGSEAREEVKAWRIYVF